MNLADRIPHRKSVRKYLKQPASPEVLAQIKAFSEQLQPLDSNIRVQCDILREGQFTIHMPWSAPYALALYSEERGQWAENIGFLFQQMDLFLQSMGLGSCWVGMGSPVKQPVPEGMRFVILLVFGYPAAAAERPGPEAFRRKSLSDISDRPDPLLEPARLAPSSINCQPWFFIHTENRYDAYRLTKGIRLLAGSELMNRIDMGIALGQLYAANADTFRYFNTNAPACKGMIYTGSFII